MSFMQWKDWNKSEVLRDHYGGKWEEEGKLEAGRAAGRLLR